MQRNYMVSQR